MIELTDKNVETAIINVFYVSENKNSMRREIEDKIIFVYFQINENSIFEIKIYWERLIPN